MIFMVHFEKQKRQSLRLLLGGGEVAWCELIGILREQKVSWKFRAEFLRVVFLHVFTLGISKIY